MFAYCLNEPIRHVDSNGMLTVSLSVGGDITFFAFGASIGIGIAIDDNWNIAVQWSYALPTYIDEETAYVGVADIGGSVALQITEDDTIDDLEGVGSYAGFSVGSGWFGGADLVYTGVKTVEPSTGGDQPSGMQIVFGYGYGMDIHIRQTQTKTLWRIR